MQTERELLELAAKAAGYALDWDSVFPDWPLNGGHLWNPLKDDGDALRLAVSLRIDIYWYTDQVAASYGPEEDDQVFERLSEDPLHVRYAIVRAAAELGRVMP